MTRLTSGAGHELPTGLPEGQQTRLDITVKDVAGTGMQGSRALDADNEDDPEARIYGTACVDRDGKPTLKLWFAATIVDENRALPASRAEIESAFQVPGAGGAPDPRSRHDPRGGVD